jgi:hypothetical protein
MRRTPFCVVRRPHVGRRSTHSGTSRRIWLSSWRSRVSSRRSRVGSRRSPVSSRRSAVNSRRSPVSSRRSRAQLPAPSGSLPGALRCDPDAFASDPGAFAKALSAPRIRSWHPPRPPWRAPLGSRRFFTLLPAPFPALPAPARRVAIGQCGRGLRRGSRRGGWRDTRRREHEAARQGEPAQLGLAVGQRGAAQV